MRRAMTIALAAWFVLAPGLPAWERTVRETGFDQLSDRAFSPLGHMVLAAHTGAWVHAESAHYVGHGTTAGVLEHAMRRIIFRHDLGPSALTGSAAGRGWILLAISGVILARSPTAASVDRLWRIAS